MKLSMITTLTNARIGHGNYRLEDLLPYLDECIDMINEAVGSNLPLFTSVYADDFDLVEGEVAEDYAENSSDNDYTRIPDAFIRNFICYETAYRVLRDEDEVQEVWGLKYSHAQTWFQKLLSKFSNYTIEDTEAISVNGDVAEFNANIGETDDTSLGYYNPYFNE